MTELPKPAKPKKVRYQPDPAKRFTPEQIAEIRADPRTAAQIAKALGVGDKLIYAVRQRMGGRATRKLPESVMTDPRTQKEIAKAYGVSETTLIRFKRLRREA